MFKFDAYFSDIFGILGKKPRGVVQLLREKSQTRPTLSFRVVGQYLQSGKVSSKKKRWHVSPLPGPLVNSVLNTIATSDS